MECIEGVLLLGLGSYTFAQPDRALTGFIVMYGIVAVTMGIADILLYVRVERFTGFGPIVSLISGALSVMTGVMLLVYPNAGKWVMSLLFPLWFLAHCIGRLSGLGLVSSHQGKGTFVCQPSEQGALNQLGNLLQPSNVDRLSVFEFRKIMESESAALAAIRATSEHVRAMEESIVAMENAESDTLAAQQDMAFHRLIAQSTGNQVIIQVFEVMRDTYTRMFEDNVSLLGKRGVQFHRQILLAIQTRDMSSARQTMLEHLDDTMRAISQK